MLTLDQCVAANRPLMFVVAESDMEILRHLQATHKSNIFYVYSTTMAGVARLDDLMTSKFKHNTGQAKSTIDVLTDIQNREFQRTNTRFETYVFLDCQSYIHDPQTCRKIKDIIARYQLDENFTVSLIFVSQVVGVPMQLERLCEVVFFDLPDEKALSQTSENLAEKLSLKKDIKNPDEHTWPSNEVVNNLKGLTQYEVEQAYLQSFYMYKKIELNFIRDFKKSAIAKTDLLSLMESDITFNDVGGLENLKNWVRKSYGGWTVRGKEYGLPLLKGLLLVGIPGTGKAQPLDSIVMTPEGPKKMGSLHVGDKVLTPLGEVSKIKKIFPQGLVDVYRITFEDGASVECTSDHLWKVRIRDRRQVADQWIVPTSFLMDKVIGRYKDHSNNLYIDVPHIARMKMKNLPIDPYILGVLIGDGSFRNGISLTSMDNQIVNRVGHFLKKKNCKLVHRVGRHGRAKNYYIAKTWKKKNRITALIEKLGLLNKLSNEKFIPENYLYSSHKQRIELLRGLMDTDGYVTTNGHIEYSTTSKKLSEDFKMLVESLGGLCYITSKVGSYTKNGKKILCKIFYRCYIRININPFFLNRKKNRVKPRTKYVNIRRVIKKIELIGKKECQCISLSDLQNLYMTNNYIITHNSLISKSIGNEWGLPVISFDPSRIFSSRVGDSEANMRRVLQIVENISPCILYIDEIEKGLAGMQSSTFSDSGVTARVIGSFLIWLQECKKPVFTVATANNIAYLPPELISRFDETFFVNMPATYERQDIFSIHLKKLNLKVENFDLKKLAEASQDLSGREIEQTLRESMYDAFYKDKAMDTDIILRVLSKKTSLLTTMAEQLDYLLKWVGWDEDKKDGIRARFASSFEDRARVQDEIEKLLSDVENKGGKIKPPNSTK